MRIAAVVAVVLLALGGLMAWGLSITAGLDGIPLAGLGALFAAIIGAALLVGLFLALQKKQRRMDRRAAEGDARRD